MKAGGLNAHNTRKGDAMVTIVGPDGRSITMTAKAAARAGLV
jgi:hypothetical protein